MIRWVVGSEIGGEEALHYDTAGALERALLVILHGRRVLNSRLLLLLLPGRDGRARSALRFLLAAGY